MHAGALRALEFDRIVEAVRRFALTPPGDARLSLLEPQTEPRAVASALAATSETVRFLTDNHIAFQAPADFNLLVAALSVEGRALDAMH
jgi:dsDNA-specific endonuclease/ATPase MutS2